MSTAPNLEDTGVSIQLMSPASGDSITEKSHASYHHVCFHSINVPSEWGPSGKLVFVEEVVRFPFN